RYLANGLDLLARDEDDKTFKFVFIDYKSLGVRQLGSIYEGLLEFKLRIAREKLAVVKGKKTEEVVPYDEAVKNKLRILTDRKDGTKTERLIAKGKLYLENDKRERKATGSYYTPDYIVKYLVENTVGPVLKEKFDQLAPEFRKAQHAYRDALKRRDAFIKQKMKPDDPEKVANTYAHVVEKLFDIKVLDPAMGSGHFLVEAADFISDRLIDFLNGFPWNPVNKMLDDTRKTILSEMEKQGVAIDGGRLTDVNLIKRHVLKRCIYGVDLNPMAVELAKVSLWLNCFTLGAPLSFLDHHLKCGNSLIGVGVEEVQEKLQSGQMMLGGTEFTGLMLATDLMRHVGELSDVTAEQVRESRREYNKASDALAPYKSILDVYTSRWFGNDVRMTGTGKKRREVDPTIEFLQSSEAAQWLKKPRGTMLSGEWKKVAEATMLAAGDKRFFHWELEFPEVFYEKGRKKENGGFEAVVGNPPYYSIAEKS
ncbi:MAG: Eco57I restriction-modification methylase domain-containing protein, partial [Terriglobia bacterium]